MAGLIEGKRLAKRCIVFCARAVYNQSAQTGLKDDEELENKEEYRRAYAIKQRLEGSSYRTIARNLDVNYRNVYNWIQEYKVLRSILIWEVKWHCFFMASVICIVFLYGGIDRLLD